MRFAKSSLQAFVFVFGKKFHDIEIALENSSSPLSQSTTLQKAQAADNDAFTCQTQTNNNENIKKVVMVAPLIYNYPLRGSKQAWLFSRTVLNLNLHLGVGINMSIFYLYNYCLINIVVCSYDPENRESEEAACRQLHRGFSLNDQNWRRVR